jgi:hypothetical protein
MTDEQVTTGGAEDSDSSAEPAIPTVGSGEPGGRSNENIHTPPDPGAVTKQKQPPVASGE